MVNMKNSDQGKNILIVLGKQLEINLRSTSPRFSFHYLHFEHTTTTAETYAETEIMLNIERNYIGNMAEKYN